MVGTSPDGPVHLTCSDQNDCFARAAEACPGGYDVQSHAATAAVVSDGSDDSGGKVVAPEKGNLVVTCKTRETMVPSWEKDRRAKEREKKELGGPLVGDPPEALAGFALGSDLEQARVTSERAGHSWTADGGQAECSGSGKLKEVRGATTLHACGDEEAVCAVEIAGTPAGASSTHEAWIQLLGNLKSQVTEKYGQPTALKRVWPVECRGDALLTCVKEKKARFAYTWSWRDGHGITISLAPRAGEAALVIRYQTPDYKTQKRHSPSADRF